jgi:mycofactocin glycosyltransferase
VSALPAGFRLVKDHAVRYFDDGRVLVGGMPMRVLRLSEAGRRQCQELLRGNPVEERSGALARRLLDAGLAHPRPPAGALAASVTIIIPVRDRARELDACLRAIGAIARVIVVDDGSSDPGAVANVCLSHGVKLLRLPHGRGPSAARNAALAHARTDLVAFVDSDTVPEQGWLEALTRHFADPSVGAVAPRIRPLANGTSLLERYAAVRSPLDMGPHDALVIPYGRVPYVPTATLVVRRAALTAGAFDEELHCGEDVDLVWRLHDAGWRVRYDASATVRHDEPRSWRAFLRRHRRYGECSGALGRRHPGRLAHVVMTPLPAASALLMLLRRPRASVLLAATQALVLANALRTTGVPARLSCHWAAKWIALTIVGSSRAATTFAAPVVAAALLARRARCAAITLLIALPAAECLARRPRMNPLWWLIACLADDFAYGIGVLQGCAREHTVEPLRPLWDARGIRLARRRRRDERQEPG